MGSVLEKNSSQVRKRIETHKFEDEGGEEYEGSEFNGFNDYFRRKKIKLQNLDAEIRANSDKPQIFKGIVAHVTGYTQPPLHVLHREIVQHGGGFLQYLDSKTMATHIVASTLPPKKSVDFSRYRIVKPAWIIDSIKAGQILPWSNYRVLDEGPRQKVLKFDGGSGLSPSTPRSKQGYREQTENSFYANQFKASSLPSQSLSQVVEKARTPLRPTNGADTTPLMADVNSLCFKKPATPPGVSPKDQLVVASLDLEATDGEMLGPETGSLPVPVAQFTHPDTSKPMTSEEHNAMLLSDPRLRKSSTANPDFLRQFYSESRLHHLSTWKAELKSKMQRLATEKGQSCQKAKKRLGARRYVMHVDFDSFFCAVSLKKNPEYIDKPAVVAHSTGSGSEIASCNYPAREFGVKNGMWMKSALEMCPELKVLPYDFPAYEEASRLFYESILDIGGLVQSVSIDEALVDITPIVLTNSNSEGTGSDAENTAREHDMADKLAKDLRDKVKSLTGCHVSVGIGANILQAKVALRKAKPAGQYQLKSENVLHIMGDLKVDQLPGVARSIGGKLEDIGVTHVKDLREVSKERLTSILGPKTGEKLREYARGIDRSEVGEQPPRKSVSAEVNWGIRFISQPEAEEFVCNLCKELEKRLSNENVKGRQLTMKIMRRAIDAPLDPPKSLGHGKCDTFNKSITFGVATNDGQAIGKEAVNILRSYKFSPGDLRGLGVQMTKLEPVKLNFAAPDGSQKKLAFGTFTKPSPAREASSTEQIDEIESPGKQRQTPSREICQDPIADDPLTPRKQKIHPAMALTKASDDDVKAKTHLNISGTQFIIPSNADATILAELPNTIRRKLMAQGSQMSDIHVESPITESRSQSPMPSDACPTQVDPEVFNALPDEMKTEILATYGRKTRQTTPLKSPHKDSAMESRKPPTPSKRGRPRGLFGKAQRQRDAQAGLLQTNFRSLNQVGDAFEDEDIEELDPEFLAELPEEMRKEVIEQHRKRQRARETSLETPLRRNSTPNPEGLLPGGQCRIQFPVVPRKISFSTSGVTSTREIKDMIDAWHSETRRLGPHRRDLAVLEDFLVKVIQEERDLEKATKLVKWLDVIVEQDGRKGRGQEVWRRSVEAIKVIVQDAVKQLGMAPLKL
ncbi:DNA repair protein REV1 [Fusarium oxysporum f. sp. radicis-lycopersici 26381]|nr:DNA repair protein REV1 [Fusarium oxysporum f. sp. lycopersici MN25]EXL49505.1 DNA repair protein REV1 [Fusarium oxysporum f. sp. radicis-lycopersici 26381]KAJ4278468.1 deoxycytidyl transferase [Fusarium oxysporum]